MSPHVGKLLDVCFLLEERIQRIDIQQLFASFRASRGQPSARSSCRPHGALYWRRSELETLLSARTSLKLSRRHATMGLSSSRSRNAPKALYLMLTRLGGVSFKQASSLEAT